MAAAFMHQVVAVDATFGERQTMSHENETKKCKDETSSIRKKKEILIVL